MPSIPIRRTARSRSNGETSSPQVAVIDNLLTDEALEKLRQFCWRSTIWQKSYPNGYLGAMPEHGFACPLLAQIADELRSTYPAIIGDHPLLRWWGFKYDSRLKGINVHADFAAVNVNFWITPDEANLDPRQRRAGGLGQAGAARMELRAIQQPERRTDDPRLPGRSPARSR